MRASQFETRHPTLLHLFIVGAAWATYLVDRVDIVWRIIRDSPRQRALEHAAFSVATLTIGAGAFLCTRARASHTPQTIGGTLRAHLLGEWLYALGLATLLPVLGSLMLIAAESIRLARLALSAEQLPRPHEGNGEWTAAIRRESVKWGIFATMIVFSASLLDRIAEYGILASLLAWALLSAYAALSRHTALKASAD